MNVEWSQRTVTIGVAELSNWVSSNTSAGIHIQETRQAGREGSMWHKRLQQRAREQHGDSAGFEIAVEGSIQHELWTLHLEGRIDQWIKTESHWSIHEIKTISDPLPLNRNWLLAKYPEYFSQAGCYFFLLSPLLPPEKDLQTALLFLERKTGITQEVILNEEELELWKEAVKQLVCYLEARYQSLSYWKSQPITLYPQWREEQQNVQKQWLQHSSAQQFFALEAPTGFGKTGLLWDWALQDLRKLPVNRVLYLTGRTSGQWQAAERLGAAIGSPQANVPLYHLQRPRSEHCLHTTLHCVRGYCPFLSDRPSDSHLLQRTGPLVQQGTLPLDTWRQIGMDLRLCPYELSKRVSPIAPVWIADYNYILGRPSNQILKHDFDPAATVLVIDEAHNLESRLLDHWTMEWSTSEVLRAGEPLSDLGISHVFRELWEQWRVALHDLPGERSLKPNEIQWIEDLLFELNEQSLRENWDWADLPPDIANTIWKLRETAELVHSRSTPWEWVWWTPRSGVLQWAPIEITRWLKTELQRYARVYLASAYLPDQLASLPNLTHLTAGQPWRQQSFQVALDLRIDTRYLKRREGLLSIAQSYIDLCEQEQDPVVAFFPSYQYAESVLAYVHELAPHLRVDLQPRGLGSREQREFLESSLLTAQGMFLILGSFAGEGIDILGGRVHSAMIISPGLPEVNPLRQLRQQHHDSHSPGSGFNHCYLEPGLTKVQQALGRLVRKPEHSARVVLVCQRFAQQQYQQALDSIFASGTPVRNQKEWLEWLQSTAQTV